MGKYTKVHYHGAEMDRYTKRALKWAEKKCGFDFYVTQGSYNVGVAASAGTHDQGGVIDISTNGKTRKTIRRMVRKLRRAGFAAWFRNWPGNEHIHACLFNNRKMAGGAKAQLASYDRGRNGLYGDGRDNMRFRPDPKVRFGYFARGPRRRS